MGRVQGVTGREDALLRGLLTGIAGFRWLAWAWMAIVLLLSREELMDDGSRPWLGLVLVGAALAVTVVDGFLVRHDFTRLLTLPIVAVELAVGFSLGAGDGWVFAGPHPQSLGSVWPLAGVFTAGAVWAGRGGAIAGAFVGLGRLVGELVQTRSTEPITEITVSAASTFVLYAVAGGVAGYVTIKLREAERRISTAQAREEVARTLHDGVLQTLAVVQRRATDPDLARLARTRSASCASTSSGPSRPARSRPSPPAGGGALRGPLRRTGEGRRGRRPAGARRPGVVDALVGAVSEALTNAGKHGGAGTSPSSWSPTATAASSAP